MTTDQPSAAFVPLPDPWPDAPVCILGALGPCDDCCTRATGGDLCGPCGEKYKAIAEVLRSYIAHERAVQQQARKAALAEAARAVCPWCASDTTLEMDGDYWTHVRKMRGGDSRCYCEAHPIWRLLAGE